MADLFSTEELRFARDYMPNASDRSPGKDHFGLLNSRLKGGTAVVLLGTDAIAIALGASLDGKPAIATLNEADGSIYVESAVWDGSGNLTITLSSNATADRTVAYMLFGA